MFYSKTCPNTFDVHVEELLNNYTDLNVDDQYQFEWYAGLFLIDRAEFFMEFNQDEQYWMVMERLAELTKIHRKKVCTYQVQLAQAIYIRRLFQHSKQCQRPYSFRLNLIRFLVTNELNSIS